MQKPVLILILLATAAAFQVACDEDLVSSYQPTLVNQTDNFHLVLRDAEGVDTVVYYYWRMEGTSANIDQNADLQEGAASIQVQDPNEVLDYESDFSQRGSFVSQPGTPGFWRVRAAFSNFSGVIDFRLQRR